MRMVAMGVHDVMRQRFGIACVAAFAALYFAVPAVAAGPEETMRETVDQVLAILKDPSLDDDQRRAAI